MVDKPTTKTKEEYNYKLDTLPSGFCCKESEETAKKEKTPELQNLTLNHMPCVCNECGITYFACKMWMKNKGRIPICEECAMVKRPRN